FSMTVASDTGLSSSDHNTSNRQPTFQGIGESNALVQIFMQRLPGGPTVLLGQVLANATGNYLITAQSPTPDGPYRVTATQTHVAGNQSQPAVLAPDMVIDTTTPAAPTVNLEPTVTNDTGISQTDHVTRNNRPTFIGTANPAEVGSQIKVFAQLVGSQS